MVQDSSSIFNFKKFFLRIFLPVILIEVALAYPVNYFLEKKIILGSTVGGAYKVNRIITETHPNEIPIFGSSRATYNFVPSMLGASYVNYGIEATRDNVMLMMMREECKKNKTSKMIISNLDMEGRMNLAGDIANYIYNSDYEPVKKMLGDGYKAYYSVPIIKHFGEYQSYLASFLSNKFQVNKISDRGGSFPNSVTMPEECNRLIDERNKTITIFHNDPGLTEEFNDLIKTNPCRMFVFVVGPYHKSYFNHYIGIEQAHQYFADLRKFKNVKVYDFSKVNYPDSLFVNTTHLNYMGAKAFSKLLKDSLSRIQQ